MLNEKYMQAALNQARLAEKNNEVPVGAILVKGDKIIARGYNLTKTKKDPTAHAEVVLLRKAAKILNSERLLETSLYVTLEPCAMCAGAIIQARIPKLFFGAQDPKAGACGSALKVIPHKKLNHRPDVVKGILKEECSDLLKSFFRKRRKDRSLT